MNDKLAAAQAEFGPIRFDAVNSHFGSRYATLQAILAAVRPVLNRHGIALVQHVTTRDTRVRIRTEVRHGTESIGSTLAWTLPADTTPQKLAGAVTYLKRIALQGLLGIAGEDDDDGNSTTGGGGNGLAPPRRPRHGAAQAAPKAGEQARPPAPAAGGGEAVTEGRCTEVKHGTTKAGRAWILATVVDISTGEETKVGSFSRTAIDALKASTRDQVWRITHKPGKSEDTRDLVSIEAVDETGAVILQGIPF